ncbi:hypothetical protein DTO271D3_5650 [Paecilomyces variotii]|nr:hypothetical protein DTO271D3_5650 [Paecilomyces variotii]
MLLIATDHIDAKVYLPRPEENTWCSASAANDRAGGLNADSSYRELIYLLLPSHLLILLESNLFPNNIEAVNCRWFHFVPASPGFCCTSNIHFKLD